MREEILRLRTEAEKALREAEDHQSLEAVRIRYLGKRGELTQLLRQLGSLDPQDRPVIGSLVNEARDTLEKSLQERRRALDEAALEARLQQEAVDVTLPGRGPLRGRLHPVTQVIQEVQRVAVGLGFQVGGRAGDRDGLLQLRSPQRAPRPPGPGHAGHVLRHRRLFAAHPDIPCANPGDGSPGTAYPHHRAWPGVPGRCGRHPLTHVPPN